MSHHHWTWEVAPKQLVSWHFKLAVLACNELFLWDVSIDFTCTRFETLVSLPESSQEVETHSGRQDWWSGPGNGSQPCKGAYAMCWTTSRSSGCHSFSQRWHDFTKLGVAMAIAVLGTHICSPRYLGLRHTLLSCVVQQIVLAMQLPQFSTCISELLLHIFIFSSATNRRTGQPSHQT